jgi:hypothetical protein
VRRALLIALSLAASMGGVAAAGCGGKPSAATTTTRHG